MKSIMTTLGADVFAAAKNQSGRLNLSTIAISDAETEQLDETATELVNERYRASINRLFQNDQNITEFTAEVIIPAHIGGFTLRQFGIFDDQDHLIMIGQLDESYKASVAEGAYEDQVLYIKFELSAEDVALIFVP